MLSRASFNPLRAQIRTAKKHYIEIRGSQEVQFKAYESRDTMDLLTHYLDSMGAGFEGFFFQRLTEIHYQLTKDLMALEDAARPYWHCVALDQYIEAVKAVIQLLKGLIGRFEHTNSVIVTANLKQKRTPEDVAVTVLAGLLVAWVLIAAAGYFFIGGV